MQPLPVIDLHVHAVSFGSAATGCRISETLHRRLSVRLLKWLYGIGQRMRSAEADGVLQAAYRREIHGPGAVDHAVLLALDAVYDEAGRRDEARTHLYVPNEYVEALARTDPRILPGASVHPDRPDALDELDRCVAAGAVLVKWLPNTQGINPALARHRPFFRKLAALGLPLLSHTGMEYSLTPLVQPWGSPTLLRTALDEGVTVIAAHGGGADLCTRGRYYRPFLALLRIYPNLYADTAALTLPPRFPYLTRLLREEGIMERLVHGSDFPLPTTPWSFLGRMSLREIRRLHRIPQAMARDLAIKRALGLDEAVFTRAALLLRWPNKQGSV
jgi:predicted TIM-barrel fold metal-dependent hydrolase